MGVGGWGGCMDVARGGGVVNCPGGGGGDGVAAVCRLDGQTLRRRILT
jgi:hypothetical protein